MQAPENMLQYMNSKRFQNKHKHNNTRTVFYRLHSDRYKQLISSFNTIDVTA